MPIGEVIRRRREKAGLSLRSLATQASVSPAYLSRVERGVVPASEELLRQIAVALACPEEELLLADGRIPESWQSTIDAAPEEAAAAIRSALRSRDESPRASQKTVFARAGNRAIEDSAFPFEHLSGIAELESWRKEIHRPIYHLHKWWAQRLGSVFRAILLGCFSPSGSNVLKMFYEPVRLPGALVLDPFMGSGTTIGEALKLGARAIGRDINHVAYFTARNAFVRHDLSAVTECYHHLLTRVSSELQPFYRARLPDGTEVDALYYFWVKSVMCPGCANPVDLFNRYVFVQDAYPAKRPRARSLCRRCGAINEVRYDDICARCGECAFEYDPQRGPAQKQRARCTQCGSDFSIVEAVRKGGTAPAHRLFAKMVRLPNGEKTYLPADDYDRDLYNEAAKLLADAAPLYPDDEIGPGYNTNQAINYGYVRWYQMFNARQLLSLGTIGNAIKGLEDGPVRDLFVCLFSGLLEFNNMFASFKGEGTGAVRHMFAHHILKPERTPLEANPLSEDGSGSLPGLFRRRVLRALRYASDPYELRTGSHNGNRKGEKIGRLSEPLGHDVAGSWAEFTSNERVVYLSCGDSGTLDLPAGSVDAVVTDPPFFDNVHYSELADFFHVWQRHVLGVNHGDESTRSRQEVQHSDAAEFSIRLGRVFRECARVLSDDGILAFTYHHSRHEGWQCLLESLYEGNFGITAVHPIKSEMSVAMPKRQAKSPIDVDMIIVCRKRQAVSVIVPNDALALANHGAGFGADQVRRFNAAGRRLSRNDVRVVLTAHAVRQLTWVASCETARRMLVDVEAALERAIEGAWTSQDVVPPAQQAAVSQLGLALG
jgi:putative DNA methylase